jgi:hypothetical protein
MKPIRETVAADTVSWADLWDSIRVVHRSVMAITTVTARRCRDAADARHGKLYPSSFRFHRKNINVDWHEGEVKVIFPSWSAAQAAVNSARKNDWSLWDRAAAGYVN